jgi:hypothetical protein
MVNATMIGQSMESSLLEVGGLSDSESLVFYQLRAVNSCQWEGP